MPTRLTASWQTLELSRPLYATVSVDSFRASWGPHGWASKNSTPGHVGFEQNHRDMMWLVGLV